MKPRLTRSHALARDLALSRDDRTRLERGAALIEAALIMLPLSMILFGIVEYGLVFKNSLTLSAATRAGARTASAEPGKASVYADAVAAVSTAATAAKFKNGDKLWIYKADVNGSPLGTDVSCSQCQMYEWNTNSSSFQSSGGAWNVSEHKACFSSADSVGVRLTLSHDAMSGFFKNRALTESSVMRFEPTMAGCE